MGLAIIQENIPTLVVASTTSVSIGTTGQNGRPTRITVGGQQYTPTSTLSLTTSGTGANGLDVGSLGAIQLWYVYAIVNQSTLALALVASQSPPSTGPLMPSGYGTAFKLVGAFYTNGSSQVGSMVTIVGTATSGWIPYTAITTGFGTPTLESFFRRNGDTAEVQAKLTCGASTPTLATYGIPFTIGSNSQTTVHTVGYMSNPNGSGGGIDPVSVIATPGNTNLQFITGGSAIGSPAQGTTLLSAGQISSFFARVSVVGWNPTLL